MSVHAVLPDLAEPDLAEPSLVQSGLAKSDFADNEKAGPQPVPAAPRRALRHTAPAAPPRLTAYDDQAPQHHAELFYLQKQIQSQTPMVIVMDDGETIEGCIEWYDRHALKVRGRTRMLLYKSAIKYMYKQGESHGASLRG